MKVFKIIPNKSGGFGCALIAADSKLDAEIKFRNNEFNDYNFEYYNCSIKEIPNLIYNSKESKIIFDCILYD